MGCFAVNTSGAEAEIVLEAPFVASAYINVSICGGGGKKRHLAAAAAEVTAAGIRKGIINDVLDGSPKAIRKSLDFIVQPGAMFVEEF